MTDDAPDIAALTARFAVGLANMMEGMAPLLEAVVGYKAQCVDAGFTEADASSMAADLHSELVKSMFT